MEKKTINDKEPTFIQAINISKQWCKDWDDNFLSDEVLADRISELIRTKEGIRGFFAYSLSDTNCTIIDKLPTSLIFKFREQGENVVVITIKNLIMSSAQVINHQRDKKEDYEMVSKNISDRCINLLKVLDTKLVSKQMNFFIKNLDTMSNSIGQSMLYDERQKEYILEKINEITR
tara:strand:- start:2353 stop:2880 length:528 start_codon:yes stop_codon:yes gene_type:complete